MRDLLQRRVLVIRCGGDKSLPDVLSRDNDPIYTDVEALVFVLDVTDQSTFSIAKYWFDALVSHLHKISKNARIFLLLHKIDLLAEMDDISNYIRATKELFTVDGLDIFIHETNVFDSSVFMAFKDVLMKEADEHVSVKQYFNQVITDSSFEGMAVYSKDGLPIYEAGTLGTVVEIAANVMLSTVSRISEELEEDDEISSTILQMKKHTFLLFKAIDKNCIFVGLSKKRPKLGQMLLETDHIVEVIRKAM
jgi:predicted regulator of Ras-like GTPase activity (Roadblock/LC7/MglB family)